MTSKQEAAIIETWALQAAERAAIAACETLADWPPGVEWAARTAAASWREAEELLVVSAETKQ